MRFSDLPRSKPGEPTRVAIWGFGLEGQAVAAELDRRGIEYVVALPDENPADVEALLAADVVIKSPGIARMHPLYQQLGEGSRTITSLTDLWLSANAHRAIGVTGTKGKSTTAALIDHLLRQLGHESVLLGNIGVSLLDDPGTGTAVVEISSYQAQSVTVSPQIVAITSLFPEHLPWHGSVEAYYADKLHLLDFAPEHVVWPGGDALLSELVRARVCGPILAPVTEAGPHLDASGVLWPGVGTAPAADLALVGEHNLANAALALQVLVAGGFIRSEVDARRALERLATFRPLEHRFELVPSNDERAWIDDSLATTPESVVAALKATPGRRVAVLVGGADRGLSYDVLLDYLCDVTGVSLVLTGPVGARLAAEAAECGLGPRVFASMAEAFAWARSPENRSEVVLLSPGATSFDEYDDYKARSAAFRRAALGE